MAGVYLGPYVPPHRHSHSTYLLSSPSVQIDPTANYTAAIMLKLKEGGEDALRSAVLRVSDPKHDDYGKFLSRDEVVAMTAPAKNKVDAVTNWLESGSCEGGESGGEITATVSVGGDVIWVNGQLKDVEMRFGTRLALFASGERQAIRASMPLAGVPRCASQHMAFVTMNTPIQPAKARRGVKISRSSPSDVDSTSTLLTRSGKVHVKQLSRANMAVGFRPHCVSSAKEDGPLCSTYAQRLQRLQISFSTPSRHNSKSRQLHNFEWSKFDDMNASAHGATSLSDMQCGRAFASSGVPCGSKYSCLCEVRNAPQPPPHPTRARERGSTRGRRLE